MYIRNASSRRIADLTAALVACVQSQTCIQNEEMAAHFRAIIVEANPIGSGLDAWLESFDSACAARSLRSTADALDHLVQEGKDMTTAL
jgi:hypothetical protein